MTIRVTSGPIMRQIIPVLRNRVPGQLVIQYTDVCNASCPQCGMRRSNSFQRSRLDKDTCRKIIDSAVPSGVVSLSFTGGEPFLYLDDIIDLLRYARISGIPYTRTGTNGFMFMQHGNPGFEKSISEIALKLKDAGVYTFWISIDSYDEALHEHMRGLPGVVEGIRKALPIFHEHGIYPSANLGISKAIIDLRGIETDDPLSYYEAFRYGFRLFYEFVIGLGFTIANACYPMSMADENDAKLNAVYRATSSSGLMRFSKAERARVYRALFDTIPEYRGRIRIFSPRCSLHSLILDHEGIAEASSPCGGGSDFFFIDAKDGDTFPCGYRGSENLGKYWDLDRSRRTSSMPCRACDWECFRDPSEMISPLFPLLPWPSGILKRLNSDREFMRLWFEDWMYYRTCGFFNCTKGPDYPKMAKFSPGLTKG